jgi:chromosome segregation protein
MEVRKMQRQIEELARNADQAQQQAALATQRLESQSARLTELERQCDEGSTELTQLRSQLASTEHQLHLAKKKNVDRDDEGERAQLEKRKDDAASHVTKRELQRQQDRVEALSNQVASLNAQLYAVEEASITSEKSKEAEIVALRRELAVKEGDISRHIQALKQANTARELETKSLQEKLAQAKRRQQSMEADMVKLQNDQKSIDIIKNARDQLKLRADKLEQDLNKVTTKAKDTRKELEGRLTAANARADTLNAALTQARGELTKTCAERDSENGARKIADQANLRLSNQLLSAKAACEQVSALKAQTAKELQELAASHTKLKATFAGVEEKPLDAKKPTRAAAATKPMM